MADSIICARAFEFGCRILKLSISRKEARETGYWLRVAIRVEAASSKEVEWELREAGELRAMIVAAIRTARKSASRGDL